MHPRRRPFFVPPFRSAFSFRWTHPITHPPFCYLIVLACLIGLFVDCCVSCQEIGELVPLAKGEGQIKPRRKPRLLCRPPRISCHRPNPRLFPNPLGNHLLKTSLCSHNQKCWYFGHHHHPTSSHYSPTCLHHPSMPHVSRNLLGNNLIHLRVSSMIICCPKSSPIL